MTSQERTVEFFFDVISPASYLAWKQLPKLVEETGAKIIYRPMFLPGLFKEAGSSSPITVPNKGKWLFHDLRRFAKRHGVKFWMNEHFPFNSVHVMRGLLAYRDDPRFLALTDGFKDAMWADNRDLTDAGVVSEIVSAAGIDPQEYASRSADPAVKQALVEVGAEAASRGAFGAPTFFVGKEMHWGQDRMDFVREALLAG
ncbi:MAG: 2-hydroxychromene-2-carboxylate isomerase [Nitratireductor sp.]